MLIVYGHIYDELGPGENFVEVCDVQVELEAFLEFFRGEIGEGFLEVLQVPRNDERLAQHDVITRVGFEAFS